ncbi:MAG: helix-turn-helix domain-containing protein [Patescibacteria group bacterium]|jgi:sugar-specific transcriptional regulator TrmB|nr:helix-turn-helix domain-containing protein [Patescibacteria group bacterium]
MYEQHLKQAGLSKEQAEIYELLIKKGPQKAGKISQKTTLKRGLVYKILEQLVDFGLVEKIEKEGQIATFIPAHPLKLRELAQKQEQQAKDAQLALAGVLPSIISDFNLVSGKPGVRFFEGASGLKQIYDDILATLKNSETFYLIRAAYEPVYKEKMIPIIDDFIKKRVKKNINVVALTPADELAEEKTTNTQADQAILFDRTLVDKKKYSQPVEIDIYGDKIAMLSFGQELIGTIIESPQISGALKEIFILAQKGAKLKPPLEDQGLYDGIRNVP